MLKTIYISRHGARQDWIEPDSVSATGMYHDPALSDIGVQQAAELGNFLSSPPELPVPQMIFSSGFYRCLQTAQPLATKLGLPVNVELGVGEWFSKASEGSGLHSRPRTDSLTEHFHSVQSDYTSTVYPSRRGEGIDELRDRLALFLQVFIKRVEHEYPEIETISIFGHAATVIVLGQLLLEDEQRDVKAGTASTSCYTRDAMDNPWTQRLNGETSYLSGGEVRSWNFGYVTYANGKVIEDRGDGMLFEDKDELPLGLAKEFEHYRT